MEINNQLLEKAYQIAVKAHEGQLDKGGRPYIEHPLKVAEGVDSPELKVIALLHDVIEDSDWTKEDLLENGIPYEIVEAVCILTHDTVRYPDYLDYVKQISYHRLARKVKMADLRHNMDISRILHPTQKDYIRLERYKRAYALLEEADKE